ncbi:MAG: response regulator [Marinoscillum sp.]|uniref:response regulator n=1 Tax=Marinoscillum sp. TaxID=2024838 RepID=UPI0032FF1D61
MSVHEIEILLIEDSVSDAELTIRALKKHNMANKLVHLENGAEALDYLFAKGAYSDREVRNVPKLILLDLNMPKIGGIEVLKQIKEQELTRKIPVIILTSSKQDPDIDKCYDLGANSYVVKPVGFESFMKAVSELGMYWMLINQPPSR